METFSNFGIKLVRDEQKDGWYFEIYTSPDGETLLDTGDELYETEGTARYAAIGHIHLMEIKINFESEHS